MQLKLPEILAQVPDFDGIRSVTVRGDCMPDPSMPHIVNVFEDVTCGTDP